MPSFDYKKNENTQEFLERKDKKIGSKCWKWEFCTEINGVFLLQRE